ncbi:Tyrosine recombinase XerC [Novipirellula aureliae]|uniref:Tyrosine recombinase XerC n=1 Tax=Novipirellula aureliae TaxID=2527966 RepID=A0A5C6DS65_9BACT|nr:site-specific integrase [Novipirellula aureliae]TWU40163.1 Tyrosine recombinase XerC [Novipirellula aureliae]
MTPYRKRLCPLTKRLAEDMKIRNMADRTIDAYTYHAAKFADFIKKPLDRVTPEDVRSFQLYLIETRKLAYSSFNQAVCALRFLYTHSIRVPWPVTMVPFGKRPKTLPVVLGRQEVDELLRCTKNLKQRTFITTLYATGMRFSEAANLRIEDIDSKRMQIHITHGKGAKQRQVPLSPRLLKELREYWIQYKPPSLLFPGKKPGSTFTPKMVYAESDYKELCEYLDREYGIGYEDWYAESAVESAMKSPPEPLLSSCTLRDCVRAPTL